MAVTKKKAKPGEDTGDPVADKQKALSTALGQIEKNYGKGAIMKLGEGLDVDVDAISTGSISLDLALGVGGVPRGRIVEIYGPESSGKTTVALHIIAEAQKAGGEAAFIDAEHALDPRYAKKLGVNINNLLVSQPDCGEDALSIADALARSGAIDVIVIDSVAALVPRQEIDGDMGASHVGLQARLMSQAMRKLSGVIAKNNCVVVFINQLRDKVGVMYGSPEVTSGGNALKYYASVRIDVRKKEALKLANGEIYGNHVKVKVVKNKVSSPFRTAEFDILFGKGISKNSELLELGEKLDIIKKSGSWFSYGEDRIGQGKDNARKFLDQNPEVAAEIEAKVRAAAKPELLEEEPEAAFELDDEFDVRDFEVDG
ncbi:MAG: recombinase RecA [Clostridiales bacterium]|nr:recombinase RecA [Clostridiales bacterium]